MSKPKYDPDNVPLFKRTDVVIGAEWRNVSSIRGSGFLRIERSDLTGTPTFYAYVSGGREEFLGIPPSAHDKEFPDLDSAVDYCFEHGLVLL